MNGKWQQNISLFSHNKISSNIFRNSCLNRSNNSFSLAFVHSLTTYDWKYSSMVQNSLWKLQKHCKQSATKQMQPIRLTNTLQLMKNVMNATQLTKPLHSIRFYGACENMWVSVLYTYSLTSAIDFKRYEGEFQSDWNSVKEREKWKCIFQFNTKYSNKLNYVDVDIMVAFVSFVRKLNHK